MAAAFVVEPPKANCAELAVLVAPNKEALPAIDIDDVVTTELLAPPKVKEGALAG